MLQSCPTAFVDMGPLLFHTKLESCGPVYRENWEKCLIQKAHATKGKQTNPRPNSQPEAETIWRYTHTQGSWIPTHFWESLLEKASRNAWQCWVGRSSYPVRVQPSLWWREGEISTQSSWCRCGVASGAPTGICQSIPCPKGSQQGLHGKKGKSLSSGCHSKEVTQAWAWESITDLKKIINQNPQEG